MSLAVFDFLKSFRRPPPLQPAFLSFDVEALPFRAPDNPLDTLIWGKTAQGEYGIRRISAILREYHLKGNFLIDLAAGPLYGDEALREVFEFLLSEGHEVHAHLHPELLADKWLFKRTGIAQRRLAEMDQRMSDALLTFSAVTFARTAGKPPFLFRSGSYLFNRHTVSAAAKAGFRALSNYSSIKHGGILPYDLVAARMEPFRWTEGLAEIPVDISSPEKSKWETFVANVEAIRAKGPAKTCNVVFHSWSLLRRNEKGHHTEFGPELEEQFRKICQHLAGSASVMGYEEFLNQHPEMPTVATNQCLALTPIAMRRNARQCPHCGAIAAAELTKDASCPGCPGGHMIPLAA